MTNFNGKEALEIDKYLVDMSRWVYDSHHINEKYDNPRIITRVNQTYFTAVLSFDAKGRLCIAFRGTKKFQDFSIDAASVLPIPALGYGSIKDDGILNGHVASGFSVAYLSIKDEVRKAFADMYPQSNGVLITGHSLGGAMAQLCALDLKMIYPNLNLLRVTTFGQPKIGDKDFLKEFHKRVNKSICIRYVNEDFPDWVPTFPSLMFGHAGVEKRLKGKIKMKNFMGTLRAKHVDTHSIIRYQRRLKKK